MKYIFYISLGIISFVALSNWIVYLLHERLIFQGKNIPRDFQYDFPFSFREIYLSNDSGELHGIFMQTECPKGLILYFHGNNGDIRKWGLIASRLNNYEHDVLLVDYRGYGKSTGDRSEQQLYQDALQWYDYAQNILGYQQITLYGRSLGSAIAVELATKVNCQKLILETPITSIYIALEKYRWFLYPKLYFKYHFNATDKISLVKCPVFIFHGTSDFVVPFNSAQSLFEKIQLNTKKIVRIDKGGHNNLNNFELYKESLKTILQQ